MNTKIVLATVAATMSAATLFLLIMFITVTFQGTPDPEAGQEPDSVRTMYLVETTTVTAAHPATVTVTETTTVAAPAPVESGATDYDAPNADMPNVDGPDSWRELGKPWRW